ncbi:MAG: tRNA lysidine(34) synthetase TilS [Verrucomicrobia bacterium]|nr:MAG: tRNA lysidine(34) synthetase TilS [Verrucomicrobiota bacterium]
MDWIQIKTTLLRGFSPDARYLIGVSGGRDSVALLRCMVDLGYDKLVVCHLDHQLRGRFSQADARFVEKLAKSYQVGFELGSANVGALAKNKKMSIEAAAREARYSFFARVAKRRRCHTIFLAHHADDLAETFLINLFRGTGLTGLGAMREVATRRIDNVGLTIVRPLLSVWRDEIDSYVREHRLRFREDASNKNLATLRNRIRHRVIPYLEKTFRRNIRQNIWRTATIAAEEENWIDNQMRVSPHREDRLSVKGLRALPVALQRRTILKWLRAQNLSEIGFEAIERVRSLVDPGARVAKVNLADNQHVRRRAGELFIF